MISDIIIQTDAANDIMEAAKWYERNLKGLGKNFLISIDTSVTAIQHNPEAYPKVYKELRRVLLKKFPFGIFYLVEGNKIVIIAVLHASRNPKEWKGRTK